MENQTLVSASTLGCTKINMASIFEPSKSGDTGTTMSLGKRVSKKSKSVKLAGQIDSLQAEFGQLHANILSGLSIYETTIASIYGTYSTGYANILPVLAHIINDLYNINSILWSPKSVKFSVDNLDNLLTQLTFEVPNGFQLPVYSNPIIAKMNCLRTKTREVEICLIKFMDSSENLDCSGIQRDLLQQALMYLNRLSSVMYAMTNHYDSDKPILAGNTNTD